ncbi:hypothetical protein HK101_011411 [Irineochytrium annulatum]|nr:hypothetical protein HK101_011411 [Irineochytrium annulatum]
MAFRHEDLAGDVAGLLDHADRASPGCIDDQELAVLRAFIEPNARPASNDSDIPTILNTLSDLLLRPCLTSLVARHMRPLLVDLACRWMDDARAPTRPCPRHGACPPHAPPPTWDERMADFAGTSRGDAATVMVGVEGNGRPASLKHDRKGNRVDRSGVRQDVKTLWLMHAFAELLPSAPQTLRIALNIFRKRPSIFEGFLQGGSEQWTDPSREICFFRSLYRLALSKLYAALTLALVLRMSDAETEELTSRLKTEVFDSDEHEQTMLRLIEDEASCPGVGKTSLIEEAARITGQPELLKVHLGDQTDSKVLLGTYVCQSEPGTFKWQPGVLTTAVTQGRWILFEDIDLAPMEVLSILLPLLETRDLFIPSRGEKITAKEGFQLFATRTVFSAKGGRHVAGLNAGSSLWMRIEVRPLPLEEVAEVILYRYQALGPLIPTMIRVFEAIAAYFDKTVGIARQLSFRDLLKWCERVNALWKGTMPSELKGFENGSVTSMDVDTDTKKELPLGIKENLLREAIDCFTVMIPKDEVRINTTSVLGHHLGIPTTRVEFYLDHYLPNLDVNNAAVTVGRAKVPVNKGGPKVLPLPFAATSVSLRLLERLAVCVALREPILLVGETGTGKTSVVQHLASITGNRLVVLNMSQQTDSSDLLGGFKPVDSAMITSPLMEKFESLFARTFSVGSNAAFLETVRAALVGRKWEIVRTGFGNAIRMAEKALGFGQDCEERAKDKPFSRNSKRAKKLADDPRLVDNWMEFAQSFAAYSSHLDRVKTSFLFSFVEGALVKALIRGILSRYTEIWVERPDLKRQDLLQIIRQYLRNHLPPASAGDEICSNVAGFHVASREAADAGKLVDGASHKVHISVRTLTRALIYATTVAPNYGLVRGLYEGCKMTYTTMLAKDSIALMDTIISVNLLSGIKNPKSFVKQVPKPPDARNGAISGANAQSSTHILFNAFWILKGPLQPDPAPSYVITASVEANLAALARAVMSSKFPVLIQGPTSVGKTSMIEYLAKRTGHRFVRVNNHEHTDLQEYIGSYVPDTEGRLSFREGILVEALRKGHWIVLDELNLAPSDVLEALNRLLDDNRELLIPETQEVVRPHPHFMLFATQNPPGLYGGRKQLSRAFRSRFLELNFDDIPEHELQVILEKRCVVPPSHAKSIVAVYRGLRSARQRSRIFEGKNAFATLRDLFRWANRQTGRAGSQQSLAEDGYMLLGERARREEEKVVVKEVLERELKAKLNPEAMYEREWSKFMGTLAKSTDEKAKALVEGVVWTKAMKRLLTLVCKCLEQKEPVLLVGETGCGKTTVCQIISTFLKIDLHIVNAHAGSETSDFLGSMRPVRGRDLALADLCGQISKAWSAIGMKSQLPDDILQASKNFNLSNDGVRLAIDALEKRLQMSPIEVSVDITALRALESQSRRLFEWRDGPLLTALREGHLFLLDEISLADDSVLERLNSVLEPERLLVLAEKGSGGTHENSVQVEEIYGAESFSFLATMNPGGDYGKKELSPALRNRFTEVWVPSISDRFDLSKIIEHRLQMVSNEAFGPAQISIAMLDFIDWFASKLKKTRESVISLRDILAWVSFIDALCSTRDRDRQAILGTRETFYHGGCMVVIDGIGVNPLYGATVGGPALDLLRSESRLRLANLSGIELKSSIVEDRIEIISTDSEFGLPPFTIPRGPLPKKDVKFALHAPTTSLNALRVCRAMKLRKPILLEDHRAEVYIPELDRTFECHPDFKVFAAQNPQHQGGGRKGLPKSFVNRFTQVYVSALEMADLRFIVQSLYPNLAVDVVERMITFNIEMHLETNVKGSFGSSGGPWEFNLRDVLRWVDLMMSDDDFSHPMKYLEMLYSQRMRNEKDRAAVRTFGKTSLIRAIASLAGQTLAEFSMSAGVDAVELMGGFEQVDLVRKEQDILQMVQSSLEVLIRCLYQDPHRLQEVESLHSCFDVLSSEVAFDVSGVQVLLGKMEVLVGTLSVEQQTLFANSGCISLRDVDEAIRLYRRIAASGVRGQFEWIDGTLIKSLEEGRWVLIDNVNFCPASVLDRLNSLFEPSGVLMVNEHTTKYDTLISSIELDKVETVALLKAAMFYYVSGASWGDLYHRVKWLQHLTDHLVAQSKNDVIGILRASTDFLIQNAKNRDVLTSPYRRLLQFSAQGVSADQLKEEPVDLRVHDLARYHFFQHMNNFEAYEQSLAIFHLLFRVSIGRAMAKDHLSSKKGARDRVTLFQISEACHSQRTSESAMPYPSVKFFFPLITSLDQILQSLATDKLFTDLATTTIVDVLDKRDFALHSFCKETSDFSEIVFALRQLSQSTAFFDLCQRAIEVSPEGPLQKAFKVFSRTLGSLNTTDSDASTMFWKTSIVTILKFEDLSKIESLLLTKRPICDTRKRTLVESVSTLYFLDEDASGPPTDLRKVIARIPEELSTTIAGYAEKQSALRQLIVKIPYGDGMRVQLPLSVATSLAQKAAAFGSWPIADAISLTNQFVVLLRILQMTDDKIDLQPFSKGHSKAFGDEEMELVNVQFGRLAAVANNAGDLSCLPDIISHIITSFDRITSHSLRVKFKKLVSPVLEAIKQLLYIPDVPVDPALEPASEIRYLQQISVGLQASMLVREHLDEVRLGNGNYVATEEMATLEDIKASQQARLQCVAFRPRKSQISDIVKDLKFMADGLLSEAAVAKIFAALDGGSFPEEQELFLQDSLEAFISRLEAKFVNYRDVLQPVYLAIYLFKYGLRLSVIKQQTSENAEEVRCALTELLRFVKNRSTNFQTSPKRTIKLIRDSTRMTKAENDAISLKIYLAELSRVYSTSLLNGGSKAVLEVTNSLLGEFVDMWLETEKKRTDDAKASEEFYKIKERRHDVMTEDDIDEAELKQSFPDFYTDFQDLELKQDNDANAATPSTTEANEGIDDSLAEIVRELHDKLVKSWSGPPEGQVERFVGSWKDAVLKSYETAGLLYKQGSVQVAQNVDLETQGTHLYLSSTHMDDLTSLIVSWRQLELRSWRQLLNVEDRRAEATSSKLWFHMFQLAIGVSLSADKDDEGERSSEELTRQILLTLDQFCLTATLGDFKGRLRIISTFYEHLSAMERVDISTARMRTVLNALSNVHKYYSQFLSDVIVTVDGHRKPILKELNGYVKIATWKDINTFALQESAKRSHYHLHKFVRKYRDILNMPIKQLIETSWHKKAIDPMRWAETADVTASWKVHAVNSVSMLQIPAVKASSRTFAGRYLEVGELFKRMKGLAKTIVFDDAVLIVNSGVDELASAIIARIRSFQEMNETIVAGSKTAKAQRSIRKKAIVDLLKHLHFIGLSPRCSQLYREQQESTFMFGQQKVELEGLFMKYAVRQLESWSAKPQVTLWGQADKYFFKNISRVSLVREASISLNADISDLEKTKGVSFLEHLLHFALEQRSLLAEMMKGLNSLSGFAVQVHCIYSDVGRRDNAKVRLISTGALLRTLLEDVVKLSTDTFESMLQARMLVEVQSQTEAGDAESYFQMQALCKRVEEWKRLLDVETERHLVTVDGTVITPVVTMRLKEILQEGASTLLSVTGGMESMQSRMPSLSHIFKPILSSLPRELSSLQSRLHALGYDDTEDVSVEEQNPLHPFCEDLINSLLLGFQDLRPVDSEANADDLTGGDASDADFGLRKNHIVATHQLFTRMLRPARISFIAKALRLLADKATDGSEVVSRFAAESAEIFGRVYPLLQQYLLVLQHRMLEFVQFHKSIGKLTYILANTFVTLFRDGFCVPKDASDDQDVGAEQEATGTGLGDGEGAKDVSDEIEDQEQVEELKRDNEASDEKQKKKMDEEENAVEMDQDIDGQLEDVDEHDDVEENEREGKDGEEELEEQMGNLDDDLADIVDEQLWGGEDKNDSKEDKTEKDNPIENTGGETETVAKQDGQGLDEKEDRDQTGKSQKNQEEGSGDESEDMDEDVINEDKEENYEESHGIKPKDAKEPDEVEDENLPEDMNLDGDEDGKDDEDANAEDDDGVTNEKESGADQAPSKREDKEDAAGEHKDEENAQTDTLKDDADAPVEADVEDGEEHKPAEENGEEPVDVLPEDNDQPSNEPESDPTAEGEVAKDDEMPEEDESAKRSKNAKDEGQNQIDTSHQPYGVEGDQGEDSIANAQEEPEPSANADNEGAEGERTVQDPNATDDTATSRSKPDQSSQPQQRRPPKKKDRVDPNPRRSLGDALKEWKSRLKSIADGEEDGEDEEERQKEDLGDGDLNHDANFEFIRDDKEAADAQAMDLATADQVDKMERKALADEQEVEGDGMDVDDELAEEAEKPVEAKEEEEPARKLEDGKRKRDADKVGGAIEFDDQKEEEGETEEDVKETNGKEGQEDSKSTQEEEEEEEGDRRKRMRKEESGEEEEGREGEGVVGEVKSYEELRREMEEEVAAWRASGRDDGKAQELWRDYTTMTRDLAFELCESLRLILEPTLATKLKGDYRTGKRLNMRKVIPYIASQFKKDKIWLRRTRPSKRTYQIMLAIDDSLSMESHAVLAHESTAIIAKALAQLEAGQMGVVTFGEDVSLVHPFDRAFTDEAGGEVIRQFTFTQGKTNIARMMESTMTMLDTARATVSSGGMGRSGGELWQLQIVISDGVCQDHATVRALVRKAADRRIMVVFVILDKGKDSIMKLTNVTFANGAMQVSSYMDTFPFDYFVMLRDVSQLPAVLSETLRQYFMFVSMG